MAMIIGEVEPIFVTFDGVTVSGIAFSNAETHSVRFNGWVLSARAGARDEQAAELLLRLEETLAGRGGLQRPRT